MRKLVIALFILGIAMPTFAGLKPKDVAGTWSYELKMDYESLNGKLKFEKNGKELTGEVINDDGYSFPMTKIEIRDNNEVYFEMEADGVPYKATMIIDGKTYKGSVDVNGMELPVAGKKIE